MTRELVVGVDKYLIEYSIFGYVSRILLNGKIHNKLTYRFNGFLLCIAEEYLKGGKE